MLFTHDFERDFDLLWNMIYGEKNIVFARYCDGEKELMEGREIGKKTQAYLEDKWTADNKLYKIGIDLKKCIKHTEENYFYGIPSKAQSKHMYNFFRSIIPQSSNKLTYSDIFVNSNYLKFKQNLKKINEPIVIIGSKRGLGKDIEGLKILDYFSIEDKCVHFYEKHYKQLKNEISSLAKKYTNTLFFICAGPMSPILIDTMYNTNSNNKYIDVGSTLDIYIHRRKTRPYMIPGTYYSNLTPVWGNDYKITAILTGYRRPRDFPPKTG